MRGKLMKQRLLIASLLLVTTMMNAQEIETQEAVVEDTTATNEMIVDETMATNAEVITNAEATTEVEATNAKPLYVETVGYTITNGETLFASPMARFEVQGLDEQSGLQAILVSVDGGEYAAYKNPISFTTEGEHSLNYQFIDRVGNSSYSKTFSVTLDATAPRVIDLVLTPAPYKAAGSEYIGPNTEFSFTSFDDLTGIAFIEYSINTQETMSRFATNTTFASLGYTNTEAFRFTYQATDMVSNVSTLKSQVLIVDATAPTVDVFAKAIEIEGIRYISSKDKISVEAFDTETVIADIFYAINDGEYSLYNEQIGIYLKEAGEYTVRAKATDVVGNESVEVEYAVVVDMLAPTGDAMYIGEALSTEYDPIAKTEEEATTEEVVTEATTTEETTEPVATEEVMVDEATTIEATEPEAPVATEDPTE